MQTLSPCSSWLCALVISFTILLVSFSHSKAYTVTSLETEYHNGQIFLTWNNPNAINLQYNVYRSVLPIILSSQLNSSTFLGFVRDSSSKNIFWSQQSKSNIFYKITSDGQPLAGSKGLYVVTCTGSLIYYYMVTVTNLLNGEEDKTLEPGNNTSVPVLDIVVQPQPVFQDSIISVNDEVKQLYVQFVNNQETELYPAMNSTGSYGFNFFITKRGTATKYPLFVIFQGCGNKATQSINLDADSYNNCYVMGVFDWLPVKQSDGTIGGSTYFCCYHENFNIYSSANLQPTKGIVKMYSQKLLWQAIKWLESQVVIDTTRLYLKGTSECGFGALLTAILNPEKIAAVYGVIEPTATAATDDLHKQLWGTATAKLKTDLLAWNSTDTLTFNDIKNEQIMISRNKQRSMPLIYDVHGKQDVTVMWNAGKVTWLDSLQSNHIGGAWYWDQRDHTGAGKNFNDDETQPDFYRFATNISYPAFSNCSVNQNPGNGMPGNGDLYGAINGYLDWDDDNITDKTCTYTIKVFIKDLYVGGVLDPDQYSTCTTDITIRRMQNFLPPSGSLIQWSNRDEATNMKLQQGSFTYNGGLLTIPGLTINKTGCRIKLSIKRCSQRTTDDKDDYDDSVPNHIYFTKSPQGYTAYIDVPYTDGSGENARVIIYDLMGRIVLEKKVTLANGSNAIEIPAPATGIFLVQVKGETFSQTEKLFF